MVNTSFMAHKRESEFNIYQHELKK